ncbi:MAG: Murein DD-endopeptidase MepM [Microgenomates bacterium OLB22]|nr:MAG: Murein DD-endopeptidase MepM [Microgenomates bacterium OLB22]
MKDTRLPSRLFAAISAGVILCSSYVSYLPQQVYAQEATASAEPELHQPSSIPSPTPTFTPEPSKGLVSEEGRPSQEPQVQGVQTESVEQTKKQPIDPRQEKVIRLLEEPSVQQPDSSPRLRRETRIAELDKKILKQSEALVVHVEKDPENEIQATLVGDDGYKIDLLIRKKLKNDSVGTLSLTPPRQLRPGSYKLELRDSQNSTTTFDILWGVLAINTNKSVYAPGEKAQIAIAVLDKKGEMVCDADVSLKIKDPKGETKELSTKDGIEVTDVCTKKLFTMEPDYKTEYQAADEGVYVMDLTAKTNDGSYSIQDSFRVSDSVPFDVERSAPTRTYPIGPYPVTLTVTARENFKGRVTDLVPDSFDIAQQETKEGMSPVVNYVGVESRSETIDETNENVLGASTSSIVLSKPFEGDHAVTLGYGDEYHAEGLVDRISNALRLEGHEGIDFDMPKGTPVLAAAEGKIIIAGEHDYGLTVTIQHDWGKTYYGHLSEVLVKEGDEVKVGQEIARSGSSGESTGPHLHFGVKPDGSDVANGYQGMVDPRDYLPDLPKGSVLGAVTKTSSLVKEISWDVDIKKGETVRLGYQFVSPPDSPRLYLLGGARFNADGKNIFQEERQWQVAVDALSTVVDGTSSLGTTFSGQRKVVRTSHGTNSNRTFVVGVSAAATISLYYTDDPDATTPSWTTVGNVSTSMYESVDMEWDSSNSVLYIVYGRNTPVDANTSDIKYKRVTDLGGTPTLGTERDALAASTTLNYTHPLVTIAQDSSTTKVFCLCNRKD